jgi:RNase P/RNase MRP subunit p30
VLDDVGDEAALKEAHEAGRPVVVRAGSAEAVKRALARPEVAAVLVPESKRELLELDLTELTYG